MSTQEDEYQKIFLYLRSLNFHYLESWVKECVNYYKSKNPNISVDVLKKEVEQQWLLVNLREIKVPSLPPDLKLKDKIILNGNYAVQVESMIDSSVSCYSQFQKLLKIDTGDIETTNKPSEKNIIHKRCLTFVICDGVQEIKAMEYQPISKIKTNDPELLPGFKMVIMGPVECRKGMILLKDENVRICGGEVDTLTISNSLKSILIKRLDLDEADYLDNSPVDATEENKENIDSQLNQTVPSSSFQDECVESLLSQNDDLFLSLPLESEILMQPEQNLNNEQKSNYNETEQDNQISNRKKHILPEEELVVPKQKKLSLDLQDDQPGPSNIQKPLDCDYDRDIFMNDFDDTHLEIPLSTSRKPVQTKLSNFFKNTPSGAKRTSIDSGKPVCVNSKPFVYFKHVMSIALSEPKVFTFKAIILTLKKKITIENDEYNLKASITDGSCSVDVDFCSEILEDLLGYSPCEMVQMLKAKQTNTAIAQRIKESFSKAQEKLISLNCLMEIKFFPNGRCPLVLSLTDVTDQHVRSLKDRKLE